MNLISFRKVKEEDKEWIDEFISNHWGSKFIVVHGWRYFPSDLPGFIAENSSGKVGLITYHIENSKCEIVTLNSIIEHKGIGTKLMKLVEEEAAINKCKSVWLITTNDNINAIRFYQRICYRITKIHLDAVAKSRELKPEIPMIGENGIPILDELEFVKYI